MDAETWQRLYGPPQPARRRPPRRRPARRPPPAWQPPPVPGFLARYSGGTLVAMGAMGAEAVVLFAVSQVYAYTQESSVHPVLHVVVLLVLVFVGVPAALGITVGMVLPLTALATWTGKRLRGSDSWWWLPIVAAVACGVLVMAVALPAGAWRGGLWWWAGLTVLVTLPGLAARPALRPEPGHPGLGRAVTLTTLYGTGAVVLTIVGGYVAFFMGLVDA
ncbi:hypothetical protein [Streptomyces thermolilacinus]|uniref:hypothetical protein n=1 Tax=Streptomyces thermolilacinus TaxID=285540 RepID=UPI00040E628B|nr:hypothetical protein [Streptomyces thermolilacinus]